MMLSWKRTKCLNDGRLIFMALLTGLLGSGFFFPDQACATVAQLIETQIEESTGRAEVLMKGLQWPPAKIGKTMGRVIALDDSREVFAAYQAIHREVHASLSSEKSQNAPEPDPAMASIRSIWSLWQAENLLRWIFLRDTTIGMFVLAVGILMIGWLAVEFLSKKSQEEQPSRGSSWVSVIPDQPIDFRSPLADPKGTRLYEIAERMGFLSPLTERITACFAAVPDHPASIQDHLNVPGGLIEHTARTIDAMAHLADGRPEEERKLLLLMALCHDLGKLFAYDRHGSGWNDRRLAHDRISALIVAGLPEFYTGLSPAQRDTLLLALRYYHNPEELPTSAPPNCYTVLEMMHKADAIAYEQEKQLSLQQVEGVKPHLSKALSSALPRLNINRYQGGYPDGFTAGEIVFILEHALREKTLEQLPQELQQKLPIRRPSGRLHPAWPLLVEVMKEQGILMEEVEGRRTNPSALFNITASGINYKCVVALSLKSVEAMAPEAVALWMQCQPYEVKIAGGRNAG